MERILKRKNTENHSDGNSKIRKLSDGRRIKDFGKENWDQHDNNQQHDNDLQKALPKSANDALKHVFNPGNKNVEFTGDGSGKILMKENGLNGVSADINQLKPEIRKEIEYQVKRYAVSEHMGIDKRDLNNLQEINGEYHYKDRNGAKQVEIPNLNQSQNIEQAASSLGLNDKKMHVPDHIGKGALEHIAGNVQEADATRKQNLENGIKNGMVYDYSYDQQSNKYTFDIVQNGGPEHGKMKSVSIDREKLPSQVENGLKYHERKVALIAEYPNNLREEHVQDLKMVGGEFHFKGIDGTPHKIKPDQARMKNIEDRLAAKGFENHTQQISDSVGSAALKHSIDQETDPVKKAAKEEALEGATIYDYSYNKENKEHTYHVVKKDIKKDADRKIEEVKDADMDKVIFTDDEYKALLDTATLNAVRKFGKLADGTNITDDMDVDFPRDDKGNIMDRTKFVVEDAQGGKQTLTGDSGSTVEGEKLSTAIKKELDVQPRADPDDIITGKTDAKDVKISTKGTDSELELLKKEEAEYKKTSNRWVNFFTGLGEVNNIELQVSANFEQIAAEIVGSHDNPGQQQPAGAVLTDKSVTGIKDHVNRHREKLQNKIKILEEHPGAGKGATAGKMVESMKEQLEDINKAISNNKHLSDDHKKELLDTTPNNKTGDQ